MGNNVINLPLESITLSKTNPRKYFDPELLTNLADNIKTHGVLQPILVRPDGDKFQLVVGERRFRASQEAKIKTIPTITKELTDKEAFELMMIENLQRQDLSEIEEARGYKVMIDKFKYKAEELAGKINKSRAYIYGRLKLVSLCKQGQKALGKGEISASTGLLVARIPGDTQQQAALKKIAQKDWRGHPMTYREAKQHIEEHYMIRLKGSGFDRKDAKLLPKAGPCTTCPKRTGNQQDLYPDTSADVCTDPECFRAKKNANQLIVIQKAKAQGKEVLTGKEAEKHMQYGQMKHNSTLIPLDKSNYDDGKYRTYQQLLGKECPPITLIQTEQGLIPTVNQKAADEVLKKKFKWARESGSRDSQRKAEDKKEAQKRKIQKAVFNESLNLIAAKARSLTVTDKFWSFLAESIVRNYHNSDTVQALVKRREIPYTKEKDAWNIAYGEALIKHMEGAKGAEVRSIIVELIVSRGGHRDWQGRLEDTFKDACAIYGIDAVQIEKEVKADEAAKAKQRKAKAKAPKKAAKTTKQKKLAV
jgi:ParB/RepB/Spo0J family partition protein